MTTRTGETTARATLLYCAAARATEDLYAGKEIAMGADASASRDLLPRLSEGADAAAMEEALESVADGRLDGALDDPRVLEAIGALGDRLATDLELAPAEVRPAPKVAPNSGSTPSVVPRC